MAYPVVKSSGAQKPNWNKADRVGIKHHLNRQNWFMLLGRGSIETKWWALNDFLTSTVAKFVPTSSARGNHQPRWMTRDIIRLIGRKKRAWKTWKSHGTVQNWNHYRELEKSVTKRIKSAKRGMEKNLANRKGGNAKDFAQYIKSKTKARTTIGPLKTADGRTITGDKEMADQLNDYFSSVFTTEGSNIPVRGSETDAVLDNVLFTAAEVRTKIRNLKEYSAPGPDGITAHLLKTAAEELADPLAHIFSESMETGEVPDIWKHARVTPIFKKGAKGEPGNYRPVSLTSIPCKLMEQLIKDKLVEHLEKHGLIRDSQHGFMKNRSCATNLVIFLDKLTQIVDRGGVADVIYLDFAKAFDKVPTKRLLRKLESKGVKGKLLDWIRNWLQGRTQAVRIGECESGKSDVESGVPQGSVLGPVLFIIFIDDLDEYVNLDVLLKFADDTKGLQEITGTADRDRLQAAIDGMLKWAEDWGMCFNVAKCKIMHVGRNNPEYEYTMNGVKLAVVEEEKDIGVVVHKSLKPTKQCQKAANIATAVLNQLAKNFHYRDRYVFVKLYMQYVRPHLEFSTPAWAPWTAADKEVLEKVQVKAINMVSGLRGATYEAKLAELNLETLENRRVKHDLTLVFKILNNNNANHRDTLFNRAQDGDYRRTRAGADPHNLKIPRARLEIRANSYTIRAAAAWNKLQSTAKNANNTGAFKRAISTLFTGDRHGRQES